MSFRLFAGELRKSITNRIGLLAALVIAANLVSLYFATNAGTERKESLEPYLDAFEQIERICSEDSEYYLDYYNELRKARNAAYDEWEKNIPSFPDPNENGEVTELYFEYSTPSTLVKGYEDLDILEMYFHNTTNYINALKSTVGTAQNTLNMLERFGINSDMQNGAYQRKIIELYTPKIENNVEFPSVVHGWDEIMSYENHIIFIFLAAILISVNAGYTDMESGVEPIMRTARKGRFHNSSAKFISVIVTVFALTLLMSVSEVIFILLRYGLSSPLKAVQNLQEYIYSPYSVSILGAWLLNILGMALSASVISAVTLMMTALTRQVIPPLIIGGLITAANLIMHWVVILGDYRYFNIVEIASGSIIKRPTVIGLSDLGMRLYGAEAVIALVILAFFYIATVITYSFKRPNTKAKRTLLLPFINKIRNKTDKVRVKINGVSLMRGEIIKLSSPVVICALVLLTAVQINQSVGNFGGVKNDIKIRASEYVEKYGGVMTAEKAELIRSEYENAIYLTNDDTRLQYTIDYATGTISSDEYFDYLQNASKARSSLPYLGELIAHSEYLLSKSEENGVDAELFYDYGYSDFFGISLDLPLYLMILFFLASGFAKEYAGEGSGNGFVSILRTTKKGRGSVFAAKITTAVLFAALLSLLFNLFDIALMVHYSGLPALTAPLCSMEKYASYGGKISVGGYLVLCVFLRVLGALILAMLESALSCLTANTKITLAITAAVTMLPYALYYFGIKIARYLDFTALLSGDRLWLISTELGGGAFALIFIFSFAVITAILTALSYKKFCK